MNKLSGISSRGSQIRFSSMLALLLTSLSALLLEFTLIRALSVSLWYHFAFMIISIAMLGIGISGVIIAISYTLNKIETNKLLAILSFCYCVTIPISFFLINQIPFDPFSLLADSIQFLYLPIYYLLITIPFLLAGLIIGTLFSRFKKQINKLYFFDLIGAGLSCFVFIWVLPSYGGSGGIVTSSMTAALSFLLFSFSMTKFKTASLIGALAVLGINILFLTNPEKFLPINTSKNKVYGNYIKENPDLKILTEWNSFSKVDIMEDPDPPIDAYPVYTAIIDAGNSTTNIPKVPIGMDSFPPPMDASNLAMILKNDSANVYIVGSGGGGEIVSSLSHNANSVTAVEINGILNELVTKKFSNYWTAGLAKNKKVKIITDDARSYLRGKRIQYDVIISAHTISASATSSGAMSLVENYIMTEDAIKDYMRHLKPDGILYISRPETQIARIVSTLIIAYQELYKLDSKHNFFIFKRPPSPFEIDKSFLAGVVYKKNGFDELDIQRMKTQAGILGLNIEYDPVSKQKGIYYDLIESDNIYETIKKQPTNLEPATDDNPYFEHQVNFTDLTPASFKESFSQTDRAVLSLTQKPAAEATLVAILAQTILIAGILIFIPLFASRKSHSRVPRRKGDEPEEHISSTLMRAGGIWWTLYFAFIGLGYIMIEICLIQRLTLFLGQPAYTMLTVISSMLIFSGIGSMFSFRIIKRLGNVLYIFVVIAMLTILIGFLNGIIFDLFVRADISLRILISAVMIAPLAFFMGMPFPYGISKASAERGEVAYAWGVNGFFSVIGSVLVVMLSMSYGFRIVFVISGIIYFSAILIAQKLALTTTNHK